MHGNRKENESYQQFGTGDGELVLNGCRVSAGEDERNSGDGWWAWLYNVMLLSWTLKKS